MVTTGNLIFTNSYNELETMFSPTDKQTSMFGMKGQEAIVDIVSAELYVCGEKQQMEFQIANGSTGERLSNNVGFPVCGIIGSNYICENGWIIDYSNQVVLISKLKSTMISLQDWAEYYFKMGIYVNTPCLNINYSDMDAWSIFKQTLEDVKSYDWLTCKGFYGVSGKQGIRVLRLNIGKDVPLYRNYCVNKIFALLNLERYPWIIDTSDAMEIIINCQSFFNPNTFDFFEDMLLNLQG